MSKAWKAVQAAAEMEARAQGVRVSFHKGSKHPWIMDVERGGQRRHISLSLNNPQHQIDWIRQDVRRLARTLH